MKEIILNKSGLAALVDDEDFYWLDQWNWYLQTVDRTYYAYRCGRKNRLKNGKRFENAMHRVIMRIGDPKLVVHHMDHNGLNNQKSNLVVCTHNENKRHTSSHKGSSSRFLGVSFSKEKNKWNAQLKHNGKRYLSFRFNSEEDAAKAYDLAAIRYFGKFANLNFKDMQHTETLEELIERNRIPRTISEEHKTKLRESRKHIDYKKLHREKRGRKVVDLSSGLIYNSAAQAAEEHGIAKCNLCKMLVGTHINKTSLVYLDTVV